MKIHISNNWCNTKHFFLYKLLDKFYNGGVELTPDPINCDIFIHSVFGNDDFYKTTKAKYKIFNIWEGRFYLQIAKERLKYSDLSISHMPTENNNLRVPLWYSWIDWWNENSSDELNQICYQSHHYIGKNLLPDSFVPSPENIKNNIYSSESVYCRPNFAAMLVGNMESDSLKVRVQIFNDITSNVEQVHGYGLAFNNRFEGNKIDLLTNYRFNICYENDIQLGYTSEKLFDAKFSGCIPLYFGDADYSKKDFNQKCFRNRLDFDNNYDFIQDIKKLNSDKNYFIDVCNEPLFNENQYPSLDYIFEKFNEVLK